MSNASSSTPSTLAFLNLLLPREGLRCGVWIKDKKVQQAFFENDEDLLAGISRGDAAGWDAYHACGSFASASRTAASCVGTRAFFLDVDCGPGKTYPRAAEGLDAVARLARDSALPEPTVVASGYGLHIYWFLDEDIDPQTWRRYAEGLKALTPWADQSRTADLASILRTPGTHNYKRGGKVPVVLGPLRGPYGIASFDCLLAADGAAVDRSARVSLRPSALAARHAGGVAARAGNIFGRELADADAIADRCGQLGVCRETKGQVSEPVWKAMMGVLAHCQDGEEIAHEWSTGDARYNESETQSKYERSRDFGPPPTCAHFAGVNAGGCDGCPVRGTITTPVQLGRGRAQQDARRQSPSVSPALLPAQPAPSGTYDFLGNGRAVPVLPKDFKRLPEGGIAIDAERDGKPWHCVVTRNDVELVSVARGEIKDQSVAYVIKHHVPSEGWHEIEVPAAVLFSAAGGAAIAGRGLVIENWDGFRKWVRDTHNDYIATQKLTSMYEQCGWKNGDTEFLAGNRLYTANGVQTMSGSPEMNYRSKLIGPRPGGSLDIWRNRVSDLFGPGREASTFALLSGFGAPLIRFLSSGEGGAVVSIVSRESGRGKSTGVFGATSIWGDENGLKLINDDTYVTRAITFGVLGNLPCIMDDIAEREPERMRGFIQRFTDGRDKMRGTREGEIRHVLANWQTLLICASNVSLVDTIEAAGGTDAMTYRVLEFEASALPAGTDRRMGDKWIREMKDSWGYAGDAFLKYLVRPDVLTHVKGLVVKLQQDLIDKHGFSSEHRFWTRALAAVGLAHAIALRLELVPWPVGMIHDWAIDSAKEAADIGKVKHTGADLDTSKIESNNHRIQDSAAEMLSQYLSEHINDMLVIDDRFDARDSKSYLPAVRLLPKRSLAIRYELKPKRMYISRRSLQQWLAKHDYSFKFFMADLTRDSVCKRGTFKYSLGAGTELSSGSTNCIIVDMASQHMTGIPELRVVENVGEPAKLNTGTK